MNVIILFSNYRGIVNVLHKDRASVLFDMDSNYSLEDSVYYFKKTNYFVFNGKYFSPFSNEVIMPNTIIVINDKITRNDYKVFSKNIENMNIVAIKHTYPKGKELTRELYKSCVNVKESEHEEKDNSDYYIIYT